MEIFADVTKPPRLFYLHVDLLFRIFRIIPNFPKRSKIISNTLQVTELMKKLAIMWQDLPMEERLKYDAMAEIDKKRFVELKRSPISSLHTLNNTRYPANIPTGT